jgi:pSer/pThr/pTyr-binding forkhead associated (FHA) protein
MTREGGAGVPYLVVLAPDSCRGQRIELSGDHMVVGRDLVCDIRFDDPHVSRAHAALRRRGNVVYLQDLGSSGGTSVNGAPVTAAELRGGDVVAFASVQARFEAATPATDETRAMSADLAQTQIAPARLAQAQAGPAPPGPVRYTIGQQQAEVVSNVGHDQFNDYDINVQQIIRERESFLREIASTKTRARWLVWIGFLLFVAGFGMFAYTDLNFIKQISNDIQNQSEPAPPTSPFGRDIGGVPAGLIGWAAAVVGILLLVVGIVLHIVATSRRRRVDREHPLPLGVPGVPIRRTR